MKSWKIATAMTGVVLCAGAYMEIRSFHSHTQTLVGVVDPTSVDLKPAPIRADWVIEGKPVTTGREIAHTDDDSTRVYVWRTTAGRFNWHYDQDEIVTIMDGEVFVTDQSKTERHLGPGDVAFFPAGSQALWRVPDHVRKIATLKKTLPEPVAGLVRYMRMAKGFFTASPALAGDLGQ